MRKRHLSCEINCDAAPILRRSSSWAFLSFNTLGQCHIAFLFTGLKQGGKSSIAAAYHPLELTFSSRACLIPAYLLAREHILGGMQYLPRMVDDTATAFTIS